METKVSNDYRLSIPKALLDLLDLKDGTCYLYLDANNKCLYITSKKRYTAREAIDKRLTKKDLTQSERNFLERLRNEL